MKRLICVFMFVAILVSGMNVFAEEPQIEVLVDGQFLQFPDQPPVMVNDRVLVPLRAIFEALGARVYYDDETRLITAKRNLTTIELTVDSDKLYINGQETIIDTPAFVQNGRTLVPVRAVSEALGVSVDWDEETPCVIVNSLFWEHYAKIESIVENFTVDTTEVNSDDAESDVMDNTDGENESSEVADEENGDDADITIEAETESYTESFAVEEKKVTIECYYPQLRSNKENIVKLNERLRQDAEAYVNDVKASVSSYSDAELIFVRDFLITYDYGSYFSYIVQDTVNGTDLKQSSFNINIDTQKDLSIYSFIGRDAASESLLDYNSSFLYYIEEQPEMFYPDAADIIEANDFSNQFYLTYKGFAYFANPGVLTDASAGVLTIEIEN